MNVTAIHLAQAVPIFFTAFCCAPSLFNIYNDLKAPSVKRMDVGCMLTMAICTGLYLIIGLCGYAQNAPSDSFLVNEYAALDNFLCGFLRTAGGVFISLFHFNNASRLMLHILLICYS